MYRLLTPPSKGIAMNPLSVRWIMIGLAMAFGGALAGVNAAPPQRLPNFVIIFTDAQGYADVRCFGAKDLQTPNLDRMAKDGIRFTNFYVAQPSCSASRAALLTGCYPNR